MDENDSPAGGASTLIRHVQPHGGAPQGWHLPLRKQTEVLVGFVGGDPDRPVIVGVAHNAHTPSVVDASNSTRNVLQTSARARLELEDREGQQYVDLSTPEQSTYVHFGAHAGLGDHNVVFGTQGDGLINAGGNRDMVVGGDSSTVVQGNLTETYHANQTHSRRRGLHGDHRLRLHATETVTGGVAQTITGGSKQSIDGGETRTVSGGVTETFNGDRGQSITGASTETVNGAQTQTVTGGVTVSTAATYTISADGGITLSTAGPMTMMVNTWLMNAAGGQKNVDYQYGSFAGMDVEVFAIVQVSRYLNIGRAVNPHPDPGSMWALGSTSPWARRSSRSARSTGSC